jgi:hypothetical protein
MNIRLLTFVFIGSIFLQSCTQGIVTPKKISAEEVYLAFKSAGLEAENPHSLTKEDYGMAPFVCTGAYFYIPSLCPDCGGRIFECDNQNDLNSLAAYYINLGKNSASLFSWVFIKGNILVQINGNLPESTARRYEQAIPGGVVVSGNQTPLLLTPTITVATSANSEVAPSPLELIETGFTVVEGPFVEYGFILKNPNTSMGAILPTVRITMRDSNDGVIGTDEQMLFRIMPGETVAWGGQANPNGKIPVKVEFEVLDPGDKWRPANQMDPVGFKPFEVVGLQANTTDFGTSFTGELNNPNDTAFKQIAVSVILRDNTGKIVVGYTGFVDQLSANGKVHFEVDSLGKVPEYATFEAYAQPWEMSG